MPTWPYNPCPVAPTYIDGPCAFYRINCSLVTRVSRQMQCDGYCDQTNTIAVYSTIRGQKITILNVFPVIKLEGIYKIINFRISCYKLHYITSYKEGLKSSQIFSTGPSFSLSILLVQQIPHKCHEWDEFHSNIVQGLTWTTSVTHRSVSQIKK